MKLHLYHGRTTMEGPTDEDGNFVDDWGFEGPVIDGVKAMSWTYGCPFVHFESKEACNHAQALVGWSDGNFENSLEIEFEADCVRTFNIKRNRSEFFGDWSLAEGVQL